MGFGEGFIWGAASSAYQVEGAANEDGRGPSVWDMMCRRGGAIHRGQTGETACDHYHRFREDVGIMKELGIKAYRFSFSWPRLLPGGTGKPNPKGIEFYDNLINELLAADIQPWPTLFHWDYPWELYCRGGWLNPASPRWFAEYARLLVDHFSDRVSRWITLNEPQCFVSLGHYTGNHAPGDKLPLKEVLLVAHNSLIAHGLAVRVIREHARSSPSIGCAPVGHCRIPATDSPDDIAAAEKASFSMADKSLWNAAWWTDPLILGEYPEDGLRIYGQDAPRVRPGEMGIIASPTDFLGLNVYHSAAVRAGEDGGYVEQPQPEGGAITAMGWPVTPTALYYAPLFYHRRYGKPIVITENGMANLDWPAIDGGVHDMQRMDFMRRYLKELRRTVEAGVPVEGYFHWSLTDNFEWAHGYSKRFGLVHIDYDSQKRTLKDSARWYAATIAANGENL